MLIERMALNDVISATPELLRRGQWQCINIETSAAWPTKPQAFKFEGHSMWIMPHTTDHYPGIAMLKPDGVSPDDVWTLLHQALSLLAWTEDAGAIVKYMTGGNLPRMMGLRHSTGITIRDGFDLTDLPLVSDERGKLALALMREGRGLNHPAYAFLSFFRALEVAIPDGKARGRWVTASIDRIDGHRAKDALSTLKATVQGDIGVHLRESGRHAIAHAQNNPIINPDNPIDARRLDAERPVIEALAVLAIEEHLGIQTSQKIYREHLYELRGWKALLGEQIVADVLSGEPIPAETQVDIPDLNIRLRRSETFTPLERMRPLQVTYGLGKLEVVYQSADGLVDLVFWLDFATERLEFDINQSLIPRDDGSATAAKNGKDLARFFMEYFGNGELQMWNADTGELISRCDAYIPLNCYLDHDKANASIARWDPIIAERAAKEENRVSS